MTVDSKEEDRNTDYDFDLQLEYATLVIRVGGRKDTLMNYHRVRGRSGIRNQEELAIGKLSR